MTGIMEKRKSTGSHISSRISKKFKNSLDSDEEDDENEAEKQNVYDPEEFEGQEESTIDHDGEIQITPFNMKDELEEGHFDKDGTFIFDQSRNEVKDQWLDDIDWVKVKPVDISKLRKNSSDSEDLPELDVTSHYKKMLELMKPNETVQAAIRRLGGSKKNSSRKAKMAAELKKENDSDSCDDKDMLEKMHLLTGYASDIIQNGDMDIYQQTYERLAHLVKISERKSNIYSEGEGGDMFGDTFEEKIQEQGNASENLTNTTNQEEKGADGTVMWEFKWEDKEDSPTYGPHSTNEMLQWVQDGYFNDGVFVRKVGNSDSQFYNSKRIDFELYL